MMRHNTFRVRSIYRSFGEHPPLPGQIEGRRGRGTTGSIIAWHRCIVFKTICIQIILIVSFVFKARNYVF